MTVEAVETQAAWGPSATWRLRRADGQFSSAGRQAQALGELVSQVKLQGRTVRLDEFSLTHGGLAFCSVQAFN